jgi:valyl-tRNA synthetase
LFLTTTFYFRGSPQPTNRRLSLTFFAHPKFPKPSQNPQEAYGGKIFNQLRRLGSSLDWSRERFTMDDMLSKAVKEAFVRMHAEGLVYRDNRLVNWCCRLKTAISDIEVDHVDLTGCTELAVPGQDGKVEFGAIWSFAYKFEDEALGEIVVATTRPETMLGDTAVAVHPDDPRYTHVHGKLLIHPFNGRKIPVICDAELVDMSFGTGAGKYFPFTTFRRLIAHTRLTFILFQSVKITPAHDPNDFATGKRHDLEFVNMLTEDGLVNDEGGDRFKGMKRFTARKAVIEALETLNLYHGKKDNPMRLGLCSRSKGTCCISQIPILFAHARLTLSLFGIRRHRTDAETAVVGGLREHGERRDGRREIQGAGNHPRLHGTHLVPVAGEHPGLVRFAAAVVGPPNSRVLRQARG